MRKVKMPSREVLKAIRKTVGLKKAAKQLGVSYSTVARWCLAYKLNHHECKNDCREEMPPELSKEQQDVIWGCLLGDGGIHNGLFEMRQSLEKEEFVKTIIQILGPLFSKLDYGKTRKPSRINGKVSHALTDWKGEYSYWCRLRSRKHDVFRNLAELFYRDGKKMVPEKLQLNWRMIAYWYCCDGTNRADVRQIRLCTDNFIAKDIQILTKQLAGLNIVCAIHRSRNRIAIGSKCYDLFLQQVEPYIPWSCFKHKLRRKEINE